VHGFIGRKKMDWSTLHTGTQIPHALYPELRTANGGEHITRGERREVNLLVEDSAYQVTLVNLARKDYTGDTIQLLYAASGPFAQLLRNRFQESYNRINALRQERVDAMKNIILPDDEAEYIDFFATDSPFTYRLELHPRSDGVPARTLADVARDLYVPELWLTDMTELLRRKKQIIFYGPPGTGKTYIARALASFLAGTPDRVRIVQFHPAYSYEDFVEGYRPSSATGGATFSLVDGPLKAMARAAQNDLDNVYVLLIDEINRGNLAKVFGEAYFLLEYRGEEITLLYDPEPFALPENVWIIGTMNTSDRSIALLDAALRRRFFFEPFFPSETPIASVLTAWLAERKPSLLWVARLVELANSELQDPNLAIGPSYFMDPDLDEAWVERIWAHAIIPYLEDVFFDHRERVKAFEFKALGARAREEETIADGDEPAASAPAI
jgi:MoxR-like ATPase